MSTANVFVKVGTTTARVHPENREKTQLLLERASKIKSPKQFRAALNAIKCGRNYPKFKEGMSTADYVLSYYDQNYNIGLGHFSESRTFRGKAAETVQDFFEPLSTSPQFAQVDETVEEECAA